MSISLGCSKIIHREYSSRTDDSLAWPPRSLRGAVSQSWISFFGISSLSLISMPTENIKLLSRTHTGNRRCVKFYNWRAVYFNLHLESAAPIGCDATSQLSLFFSRDFSRPAPTGSAGARLAAERCNVANWSTVSPKEKPEIKPTHLTLAAVPLRRCLR